MLSMKNYFLRSKSNVPITIVFNESLEHIPEDEGNEILRIISTWSNTRLIIVNVLGMHPIAVDDSGWNHIRRVDDALYDRISAFGTVAFRRGSHLVVDIG